MDKKMLEIMKAFERLEEYGLSLNDTSGKFAMSSKDDEFQELVWDLISLLRKNGFCKEAFICTEQLITCTDDPEPLARYYMTLGQLKALMNDFETAILYYLNAKSLQPTDKKIAYFIRNDLGYCFNKLALHEEAEGYCRAAIIIDSDLHNAYRNLGISLRGKGLYTDAARNFIRAVDADPADPRAIKLLVNLLDEHEEIACDIPDITREVRRCFDLVSFEMDGGRKLTTSLTH